MNRLSECFYEHVFYQTKKKQAEERVKQLITQQNQAYDRLMEQTMLIEKEVKRHGHE